MIPGPPFPRAILEAFWLAPAAACALPEGPESNSEIYKQHSDAKKMNMGKLLHG